MQHYSSQAFTDIAKPAGGATIAVKVAGTNNNASIFSDDGITAKSNPFNANSLGQFDFYAASGKYDITISGTQITTYTLPNQVIFDPFEKTAADTGLVVKNITADTFIGTSIGTIGVLVSNSSNPAGTGVVRLANTDTVKFRNAANNADVTALSDVGAAAGTLPADVISVGGGGLQSGAFISGTSNPASFGVLRLAKSDLVFYRNNANSGDVQVLSKNTSDLVFIGDILNGGVGINGVIANYNNLATAGNGVPSVSAQVHVVAQSANIAPTTLVTPVGNIVYRFSYYAVVTAGGNAVTITVQLNYTDFDSNTAVTQTSGTLAMNGAVGTLITGSFIASAKSAVAVQYQTNQSGALGAGRYALFIELETL